MPSAPHLVLPFSVDRWRHTALLAFLVAACNGPAETPTGPVADVGPDTQDAGWQTPGDAGDDDDGGADGGPTPRNAVPAGQDILTTHLALDLGTMEGRAEMAIKPAPGQGAVVLHVGGLVLREVLVEGLPARVRLRNGLATIEAPQTSEPLRLALSWGFSGRMSWMFDGWMPELQVSFIWPYYCHNLFPCNPSMSDGVRFTMEVSGVVAPLKAIYPPSTVGEAPAYLPAVAVGAYETLELGSTGAGTRLTAWYRPDIVSVQDARQGTAHLVAAFDFLERTYGPYAFGDHAGTVSVDWGEDSWGGMEYHPFFHVPKFDFGNAEPQIHEAVHGWFGNAVRLACWEDFVLSEGTTTYITARAMEEVGAGDPWPMYVDYLDQMCTRGEYPNTVAWPQGCGEIDFVNDPLWSLVPYMKGACFYEEVADLVGWPELDARLATFYAANRYKAARMQEMVEHLQAGLAPEQAAQIEALAEEWLRQLECPQDYAQRCGTHRR